jgi:hypothetical protein
MIYMDPKTLGIDALFESWINSLPNNFKYYQILLNRLRELHERYLVPTLAFARKELN